MSERDRTEIGGRVEKVLDAPCAHADRWCRNCRAELLLAVVQDFGRSVRERPRPEADAGLSPLLEEAARELSSVLSRIRPLPPSRSVDDSVLDWASNQEGGPVKVVTFAKDETAEDGRMYVTVLATDPALRSQPPFFVPMSRDAFSAWNAAWQEAGKPVVEFDPETASITAGQGEDRYGGKIERDYPRPADRPEAAESRGGFLAAIRELLGRK